MIDKNKDTIILTHPRSGSNWFQLNLHQFNLSELFNLGIHWQYTDKGPVIIAENQGSKINTDNEIIVRLEKFYFYQSKFNPVSVKIHLTQWYQPLEQLLTNSNFQIIDLRRKNIIAVIWSYLIAMSTHEWIGHVKIKELTISRSIFDIVISALRRAKHHNEHFHKVLPNIITIYYEDILNLTSCDYWLGRNVIPIQAAKNRTNIINRQEVESWISELNLHDIFPENHESLR